MVKQQKTRATKHECVRFMKLYRTDVYALQIIKNASSYNIMMIAGMDLFCGLKNQLYTAVKTGDVTMLEDLLNELRDLIAKQEISLGNIVCMFGVHITIM